ncbi:CDPK-related kinase 5 [Acorus gramineus]|uniref:CDPK-related kinase 5 n=1 Tax=Acorus gramineus TaxID=55184 RepID=A0AAV9B675_ACOGR|nr:CDPK-related kinase 5 [Acorus gramineus]
MGYITFGLHLAPDLDPVRDFAGEFERGLGPAEVLKRSFPPPSRAKHIKALLARMHRSVKLKGGYEEAGGGHPKIKDFGGANANKQCDGFSFNPGFNFVVYEARRYGIILIIILMNDCMNFGGKKQYV